MRRGKRNLLETTDLPIIETTIEEGTIPYFIIDDKYGIACDDKCEMICRKKKSNRTIKDEEGNPIYIETYYVWESFCYVGTFSECINRYLLIKDRDIKKERLVKTKDYGKLIEIQNEIKCIVSKALDTNGVNSQFLSATSIIDDKAKLKEELDCVNSLKEDIEKEYKSFMEMIKDKRKIIIKNTEPTKHRTKKEEE